LSILYVNYALLQTPYLEDLLRVLFYFYFFHTEGMLFDTSQLDTDVHKSSPVSD